MTGPATTADIPIPALLIDQVIGQDEAKEIVRLAARQRRFLLLIGEPGTGKSLLAKAVADLLPAGTDDEVVVASPQAQDPIRPLVATMSRQQWAARVDQAGEAERAAAGSHNYLIGFAMVAGFVAAAALAVKDGSYHYLLTALLFALVLGQFRRRLPPPSAARLAPKLLFERGPKAPFVDATGLSEGALFGDVRHDPYQSGGQETPPHQLVEAGAIHRAHGGVLYIDEISTLSEEAQRLLLTAIQEKSLAITGRHAGSSGTLVTTAAVPCDFVLVAAGNLDDPSRLLPALRSRMLGLGYEVLTKNTMDDRPSRRADLWRFIAQEVHRDGRIPHFDQEAVEAVIAEAARRAGRAGQLTARLRELGGLVRVAGDLAVRDGSALVRQTHVLQALTWSRPVERQGPERQRAVAPTRLEVRSGRGEASP